MDELNNPTYMKCVLAKLPFKLKERWRSIAYDIKERTENKPSFMIWQRLCTNKQRLQMTHCFEMSPQVVSQVQQKNLPSEKIYHKQVNQRFPKSLSLL